MVKKDVVETVLEYGPAGNVNSGSNCAVYNLGNEYMKLVEDFFPNTLKDI